MAFRNWWEDLTPEQIDIIEKALIEYSGKKSYDEISRMFDVSDSCIRTYAKKLRERGYDIRSSAKSHDEIFTDAKKREIARLLNNHLVHSYDELSKATGIATTTMYNYIQTLRGDNKVDTTCLKIRRKRRFIL